MDYPVLTWIAAIFCSAVGLGSLVHLNWVAAKWPRVMATVVGNCRSSASANGSHGRSYFAKLKFVTHTDEIVYVNGDSGRSKPYIINDQISLCYKPANPRHFMTLNIWERLFFSGGFLVFAIALWAVILGYIGN